MNRHVRAVRPLAAPPDATITIPGSKSLTNRALVCAALAEGTSVLEGVLIADDTDAMEHCLRQLGVEMSVDGQTTRVELRGIGGRLPAGPLDLFARQSGTTARFLLPVLALGAGPYRLDGSPQLRHRPMAELIDAVRSLGVTVDEEDTPGFIPVTVSAPGETRPNHVRRRVTVRGDITSQFLSALMLAAPCLTGGLGIDVEGDVVSRPYVSMTASVMSSFGASVAIDHGRPEHGRHLEMDIQPGGYRGRRYDIEPDASSASYFFAAAAITGGRVRVDGLTAGSLQGDVHFVEVLERMGAGVRWGDDHLEVHGTGVLHGIDVDLVEMPDMASTLAAVAVFADGPTRVRGVQIIHGHETDRIVAITNELRAAGIDIEEHDDGWTIWPALPQPTRFHTYDDHRMAMSLALLGLRAEGIEIADPECVAKTFPGYFAVLDRLRR